MWISRTASTDSSMVRGDPTRYGYDDVASMDIGFDLDQKDVDHLDRPTQKIILRVGSYLHAV